MHVSILVPRGEAILSSVVGPYKIFNAVNHFLLKQGHRNTPFYDIDFVGIDPQTKLYDGIFSITPTKHIHEVNKTDLVIISTIFGDMSKELENNAAFIPWIQEMHKGGSQVASLCVGAFLLAATGLVNGKDVSTHWSYANEFQHMFPDVNLRTERIITEDAGIYSSGGSYSFLNLLLYLVQKFNGKDMANWVAKMFEIEIDRTSQQPFLIFQGQKNHEDETIRQVQEYLEQNYLAPFSLDDLSRKFAISKRNLIRRFKRATHNTPHQYFQRIKVEVAKHNLEKSQQSISEVMSEVGYQDMKSFRQTFKKIVGIPPSRYRTKYGRA